MTAATTLPARDVPTTLNYFKGTSTPESPYRYVEDPPAGKDKVNTIVETKPVTVTDLRGKEDTVGLDKTGFQFIKHESAEKHFDSEDEIRNRYYPEVEELLKKHAGAKRVVIFDHTIRRNYSDADPNDKNLRGPVSYVHIDQTFQASINRVRRHVPEDADRLLQGRVRLINVWRPIENTVAHHPLAVADYFSISPEDLVSTRLIYPDREGTTFSVRYNPQHRWYFLGNQAPDEVTLIKCFDSDESRARLTPHSAFFDEGSPKDAPARQSIEVRALVFDSE